MRSQRRFCENVKTCNMVTATFLRKRETSKMDDHDVSADVRG
jgi:hypothetical protein